jgi:SAM-dependent methyltransferase
VALSFAAWLACPACEHALRELDGSLYCAHCKTEYETKGGVARLGSPPEDRTERVRRFYAAAPFPGYRPRDSLGTLRARAERSEFARLLDRATPADAHIVEIGCGTGQMSLFLATADRIVVGADLSIASLELAAAAARRFGVERAFFVETDLRRPGLARGAFDLVYTSGVLHHTPDPRASFAEVARLAKPGGIIVLGLYNRYARLPHRARRAAARLTSFRRVPFDPVLGEREAEGDRRMAWFRDQYLHFEEHCHTIAEVQGWFRENDVEYLRTFPSALIADAFLRGEGLFTPAGDDWWFENWLSQMGWAVTLGREGGLFVTVGRRGGSS